MWAMLGLNRCFGHASLQRRETEMGIIFLTKGLFTLYKSLEEWYCHKALALGKATWSRTGGYLPTYIPTIIEFDAR